MTSPVALFIYNRPEVTRRCFESIARVRPRRMLVVADGPRDDQDAVRCRQARKILEEIDWTCELSTEFSEINLGCRQRMSSGISWVFEQVPEAILVEDDCLLDPSFFAFADELLERYRDDPRVMMISAQSFLTSPRSIAESYFFSRFALIWGWATWRRAWRHYDVHMENWERVRSESWLRENLPDPEQLDAWRATFDRVASGDVDTWDFQWAFACRLHQGLAAVPTRNLVSNLGFGNEATHTKRRASHLSKLRRHKIRFPLVHPAKVRWNASADQAMSERINNQRGSAAARVLRLGRRVRRAVARRLFRDSGNRRETTTRD